MMIHRLRQLASNKQPIRVGLAGAGCMGYGISHQIAKTPGMELVWVGDQNLQVAQRAASLHQACVADLSVDRLFDRHAVDVFVESTNSISGALDYSLRAIEEKSHLVLMNAEVDLAFGAELLLKANQNGVVLTSDAGDQHGVLATMIGEIEMWGFEVVQAGNIKGFLNRYATAAGLREEAAKRNLNPLQCCAYTDGTKLNIEMSVLANGLGYLPSSEGMSGPEAKNVQEALGLFDLSSFDGTGSVDYLLGAEPGGGVYVIGRCEDAVQMPYLTYYKLGDGPYYLFYRPYHLCHLETPMAIAKAALLNEPILQPLAERLTDTYARAKCDLAAGTVIEHAIGGDCFYGMIDVCEQADAIDRVPMTLLETCENEVKPILSKSLKKNDVLSWSDLEMPQGNLRQRRLDLQQENGGEA